MTSSGDGLDGTPLSIRYVALYLFAAFVVATILNQSLIVRMFDDRPGLVGVPMAGPRTEVSDNYVYFGLMKTGLSACRHDLDVANHNPRGNPLSCTYIAAVEIGHLLYRFSDWLMPSKHWSLALLVICNTAAVAWGVLMALHAILRRPIHLAGAIATGAAALLLIENFGFSAYAGKLDLEFARRWSVEPYVLRLLNPTLIWGVALAALAFTCEAIRRNGRAALAAAMTLAMITGSMSLPLGLSLVGGLGFAALLNLRRPYVTLLRPAAIATAAIVGLSFQIIQFRFYWASELGAELQHGLPTVLRFNPNFLAFLVPVVLDLALRKWTVPRTFLSGTLLVTAMIGMFCESVELGVRLWLRGAAAFAFVLSLTWIWEQASHLLALAGRRTPVLPARQTVVPNRARFVLGQASAALGVAVIAICAVLLVKQPTTASLKGYIDTDKADVLAFLAKRSRQHETIASSDIVDSFLIDFYTSASPLVAPYGLIAAPTSEIIERYFHTIGLLEHPEMRLGHILNFDRRTLQAYQAHIASDPPTYFDADQLQAVLFFEYLTYYRYNKAFSGLFDGDRLSSKFSTLFADLYGQAQRRTYDFDYFLMPSTERPPPASLFVEIYRNGSYAAYERRTKLDMDATINVLDGR